MVKVTIDGKQFDVDPTWSIIEAARDNGREERLLGAEEPEHVRLRDAGATRDVLRRRAVEAPLRELLERRVEDLVGLRDPVHPRATGVAQSGKQLAHPYRLTRLKLR